MGNHCRELWIWSWVITKFERKVFLKMKFIGVDLGKYKGGIFDGENKGHIIKNSSKSCLLTEYN